MRRVWPTADKGLPVPGVKTPDAPGEISFEHMNASLFSRNLCSAMCLPLVNDAQRVIWIPSNQIALHLKDVAELGKAFDTFPYLTQRETVALAKRCSLHPDGVRLWFMAQRIRYGISWEYKDILLMKSKLGPKKEKDDGLTENKSRKKRVRRSGWKTAMDGEIKPGQAIKKENEEEKNDAQNKRKRLIVRGKKTEKKVKQGDGEEFVVESMEEGDEHLQKDATNGARKKKKDKGDGREIPAQEWTPSYSFNDIPLNNLPTEAKSKENIESSSILDPKVGIKSQLEEELKTADEGDEKPQELPGDYDTTKPPTENLSTAKIRAHVNQLRMAFLHCQYPNEHSFHELSQLLGVSGPQLKKWFSDKRYHVKQARPVWMSKKQHGEAIGNIRYCQYLKATLRSQQGKFRKLGEGGSEEGGVPGTSEVT